MPPILVETTNAIDRLINLVIDCPFILTMIDRRFVERTFMQKLVAILIIPLFTAAVSVAGVWLTMHDDILSLKIIVANQHEKIESLSDRMREGERATQELNKLVAELKGARK